MNCIYRIVDKNKTYSNSVAILSDIHQKLSACGEQLKHIHFAYNNKSYKYTKQIICKYGFNRVTDFASIPY